MAFWLFFTVSAQGSVLALLGEETAHKAKIYAFGPSGVQGLCWLLHSANYVSEEVMGVVWLIWHVVLLIIWLGLILKTYRIHLSNPATLSLRMLYMLPFGWGLLCLVTADILVLTDHRTAANFFYWIYGLMNLSWSVRVIIASAMHLQWLHYLTANLYLHSDTAGFEILTNPLLNKHQHPQQSNHPLNNNDLNNNNNNNSIPQSYSFYSSSIRAGSEIQRAIIEAMSILTQYTDILDMNSLQLSRDNPLVKVTVWRIYSIGLLERVIVN